MPTIHSEEISWFASSNGKYFSRGVFSLSYDFLITHSTHAKTILTSQLLEDIAFARLKLDFLSAQRAEHKNHEYTDRRIIIE
ncbi:unnamed protein product, partial [marine sediment metagenome]